MRSNVNRYDDSENSREFNFFQSILCKFMDADLKIFIVVFVLMIIGMIFIFSATMFLPNGAEVAFDHVQKQLISIAIGSVLMVIMMLIPFKIYKELILIHLVTGILAIIMIFTAVRGKVVNGSSNWLEIGPLTFQPSEFAKVALCVLTAWHATFSKFNLKWLSSRNWKNDGKSNLISKGNEFDKIYPIISIVIIVVSLLALSLMPDYGMIMLNLVLITLVLVINWGPFWANVLVYFIGIFAYFGLRVLASVYGPQWIASQNYGLIRIGIFVNPFIDPSGAGYQLIQSLSAFSRGGLFGAGIGQGLTKQISFPEAHTDFIFAVIGEEVGLVGLVILLILIYGLYIYLFKTVSNFKELYRRNIGLAIIIMFLVQTTINIGGALSIIPLTGVTLPFISYGGTSIMVSMAAIGIIQAMIIQEKENVRKELDGDMEYGV